MICCCSVAQLCLTPCDLMDCRIPGFPVLHHLSELTQLMSIELVMSSNNLILCCTLLLLPSIFTSIRVFSNESTLRIWWPIYWSFSFSIPGRGQEKALGRVWSLLPSNKNNRLLCRPVKSYPTGPSCPKGYTLGTLQRVPSRQPRKSPSPAKLWFFQ